MPKIQLLLNSEIYESKLQGTVYELIDGFVIEWESLWPEHKYQGYNGKINIQDLINIQGKQWALSDDTFVFDNYVEESFALFDKWTDSVSIRNWSGDESLSHLNLDTVGYLRMAIATKGFRLWQHMVISFKKNEVESCPICKDYVEMMPEIFDNYMSIDDLRTLYAEIRI